MLRKETAFSFDLSVAIELNQMFLFSSSFLVSFHFFFIFIFIFIFVQSAEVTLNHLLRCMCWRAQIRADHLL
jgi:hypothetical protein